MHDDSERFESFDLEGMMKDPCPCRIQKHRADYISGDVEWHRRILHCERHPYQKAQHTRQATPSYVIRSSFCHEFKEEAVVEWRNQLE